MPWLMFILNSPFIFVGFIPKYLAFKHNGYDKDLIKGTKNAFKMMGKIDKPKFEFKNLPNYLWVEWQMFKNIFVYIDYRIKRALKIK